MGIGRRRMRRIFEGMGDFRTSVGNYICDILLNLSKFHMADSQVHVMWINQWLQPLEFHCTTKFHLPGRGLGRLDKLRPGNEDRLVLGQQGRTCGEICESDGTRLSKQAAAGSELRVEWRILCSNWRQGELCNGVAHIDHSPVVIA